MSKLRFEIAMSADGYVAGPNQSEEHPLGEGGERLHEWVIKLAAWRESHGRMAARSTPAARSSKRRWRTSAPWSWGATCSAAARGPGDDSWRGWWGEDPPFHVPVFVLTHHEREPLEMEGGTTFHFVTDGIESALDAGQGGRRRQGRAGSAAAPKPRSSTWPPG